MKEDSGRPNLPSTLTEDTSTTLPGGLETTFRECHGMVFRTAYRITGNAADAEDVLQVVFLRLLRRQPGADDVEHHESYLRRAAINASLDVIRSRQAARTVELPLDMAQGETPELRRALTRALAQLKPRAAEIFTLRFLEGFTNPEIAKMLGISQVLVAVTIYRARQQLQRELSRFLRGGRP